MKLFALLLLVLVCTPVKGDADRKGSGLTGKALFFPCRSCHGDRGEGRAIEQVPAIAGQLEGYLERQMLAYRDGRRGDHPRDTWGERMAIVPASFSNSEISRISRYVASLKPAPAVAGGSPPITDAAFSNLNAALLASCTTCHGSDGEGREDLSAPRLAGLDAGYLARQIRNFRDGIRGSAQSSLKARQMQMALPDDLDNETAQALGKYFQSLKQ